MSEQYGDGAWFRVMPRRLGWGYTYMPITWQGWALALGLAPALLLTVFAGDPATMHPHNPEVFLQAKALLGLSGVHLSSIAIAALIVSEVAAFVLLLLWKSRPLRPLD